MLKVTKDHINSFMLFPLEIVVWFYDIFDNEVGYKKESTKYLKEICWWCSDQYFPFKYF